jgi:mannose-6-phosphate isomerase
LTGPRRLHATFHEKPWGSTDLAPWFPKSEKKIGEVWFGADQNPRILVKFIFTTDKLSIQVHPPGKTEMWHILRAQPGARLALGFREPISRQKLRESAESGEIETLLRWFPVEAGETYFTPAGTVHAIGPGIALCEIQQNFLVTYRLYDYGRPRDLHLDAAAEVAHLGIHPGASQALESSAGRQLLVRSEYFETERLEIAKPTIEIAGPALLVFVEGCGTIAREPFHAGEVWQLPEGAWRLQNEAPVRVLRVRGPEL